MEFIKIKANLSRAQVTLADFIYPFCFPLACLLLNTLNYLIFQSFDYERTFWRLYQKRIARTEFYIYVFIKLFGFPIFWLWKYMYLMKVVSETHCAHSTFSLLILTFCLIFLVYRRCSDQGFYGIRIYISLITCFRIPLINS